MTEFWQPEKPYEPRIIPPLIIYGNTNKEIKRQLLKLYKKYNALAFVIDSECTSAGLMMGNEENPELIHVSIKRT